MRFRTWPVVALALVGLLTLIAVSLLAARSQADHAYTELDSLNARHRNVETRLRLLRSDLQISSILIRDYLLDESTDSVAYRSRLLDLKTESDRTLAELNPLIRPHDPVRYDLLENELDKYWLAYDPLFEQTLNKEAFNLLRREVLPRRDAVVAISEEIENINNANLNDQRQAAADRQGELRRYLTSMLVASLTLGLIVAIAAVVRIRVLERRAQHERARTEEAEQEMRRLSNQLVRTQEEERKSLSRELHDEVGQMLTALRMEMGRMERAHSLGSPTFSATVTEGKTLIDRMMRLVRDLAMGLRPSMLDDLGLEPALSWQAREFSRRYNVPVDLEVEGDIEHLPDAHRTCVYRVVQEALTNCAKHSGATEIKVAVRGEADRLVVTVRDNGVGIDLSGTRRGLGLTGIKERIKEMSGQATIERGATGGTVSQATLPVVTSNEAKERRETRVANTAG